MIKGNEYKYPRANKIANFIGTVFLSISVFLLFLILDMVQRILSYKFCEDETRFFALFLILLIVALIFFMIYRLYYNVRHIIAVELDNCKSIIVDNKQNELVLKLSKNKQEILPIGNILQTRISCGRLPQFREISYGVLYCIHIRMITIDKKIYRITLPGSASSREYWGKDFNNSIDDCEKFLYNKVMTIVEMLEIPQTTIEKIQISTEYKHCWHNE